MKVVLFILIINAHTQVMGSESWFFCNIDSNLITINFIKNEVTFDQYIEIDGYDSIFSVKSNSIQREFHLKNKTNTYPVAISFRINRLGGLYNFRIFKNQTEFDFYSHPGCEKL